MPTKKTAVILVLATVITVLILACKKNSDGQPEDDNISKYLKDLEEFNAKSNSTEEQEEHDSDSSQAFISQLVAVINNENEIKFILKR